MTVSDALTMPENLPALDRVGDPLHRTLRRVLDGSRAGDALRGAWLGHPVHPSAATVPLGSWTAAVVLESVLRDHRAARRLIGLGLVGFPFAAVTGWADWSLRDTRQRRAGLVHAVGNATAALAMFSSYRQRANGPTARAEVTSVVGVLVAGAAGALGGHIAFGGTPAAPGDL